MDTGSLTTQKDKAERFYALHHCGKMLVLPNIWEPLGARLLESLNFPAVATASAAVAFTNGYDDGENIPFGDLLTILKKITASVNVPVTADVESGYADNDAHLETNIRLLLHTGIAGINIEDTNKKTNTLYSIEAQCKRIKIIKKIAAERDIPLFVNARTDAYLPGRFPGVPQEKFNEMLRRGLEYKEAGADCFFPIALTSEEEIKNLLDRLKMPINILTIPGIPDLKTLSDLGVARVSLGPNLLKVVIKAMKELALQLQNLEGLPVITNNEITTDYLKDLVKANSMG